MATLEIPQIKIVRWIKDGVPFGLPPIEVLVEICILNQYATMGSVYLDKPLWSGIYAGTVPVGHIFSHRTNYASEILSALSDISNTHPKVTRVGILFPQSTDIIGCTFDAQSIVHTITKSFVQDNKTPRAPGSRGYRAKLSEINEVHLILHKGNNEHLIEKLEEALEKASAAV